MKDSIYIALIAILAIFGWNQYSSKNFNESVFKQNLSAANDSTIYFKNKFDQEVASKKVLQLSEKDLMERLKEKDVDLKNVKKVLAYVKSKQEIRIDTIEVIYKDSITSVFSHDFSIVDKWYSIDGISSNRGHKINNFTTFNDSEALFNWKYKERENWFKKRELEIRVDITNSNPYFKTIEIEPIIIVVEKKWHEKPIYTIPLGIAAGYIMSKR